MITLQTNKYLRKITYSLVVICIPFLFYKMARHPDKGYGLLMILFLLGAFFAGSVLKLFILFGQGTETLPEIVLTFNKFNNLWMVCLALFHYFILQAFRGKFRIFPFKPFIFFAVLFCILTAIATNAKILTSWAGDSYLLGALSIVVLLTIACKARHLKNNIHMIPFSVYESASKLYTFSVVMACFPLNEILMEYGVFKASCPNEGIECVLLDLYSLMIYQVWCWYAVYFNWKALVDVRGEEIPEDDTLSCPSISQDSFHLGADA